MKLEPDADGTLRVVVVDPGKKFALPWDRYQQLSHTAKAIAQVKLEKPVLSILDAGGTDGAIALFLPDVEVLVGLPEQVEREFDVVVSFDVLAQLEPRRRGVFLAQMSRLARTACVVTFPLPASSTAQKAVAAITDDTAIGQRVRLGLPYSSTVRKQFEDIGYQCSSWQHSSRSLWVAFAALKSAAPDLAGKVSRYLIEEQPPDGCLDPLYETLLAVKS